MILFGTLNLFPLCEHEGIIDNKDFWFISTSYLNLVPVKIKLILSAE